MHAIQTTTHSILFLIVACILILCATMADGAQGQAGLLFTLKQVGPNVWAAIGPQGQSNAGIVIGDDGVLVIDTFITADAGGNPSAEAAKQLLTEIRKLTKLPVRFVVNTHHHLDHVGGNSVFADAGATLLAQRNVRDWIHTENVKLFGNALKPEQRAFIEGLARPGAVFDEGVDLHLGSRPIYVRSLLGHTGGDSVVLVPDAKVIFTGDLFWRNILPNLVNASTKPWIETLDTLLMKLPDYTFVPGHGDVGNARDAAAFRDYLSMLRTQVAATQAQGKSGDDVVKSVLPELTDKYGGWGFFNYISEGNIADVSNELMGTKKVPQPDPSGDPLSR
jgi:cyclase